MTTTRIDEVAEGIYRISTLVPEIGPDGFSYNQFFIDAEEPLLSYTGTARSFNTGHRSMFASVAADRSPRRARLPGVARRDG